MTGSCKFVRSTNINLSLPSHTIHVWCVDLNQPPAHVRHLKRVLSKDELQRADWFHFEQDRKHFVVGRGTLRTILGAYAGIDPGQLVFVYGAQVKPALAETPARDDLFFNVSYSEGLALCAVARCRNLGVDVEYVRPVPESAEIVERFFTAAECRAFRRVSQNEWPRAFFNCWTRKEAYLKAIGGGLSVPLNEFEVSLPPGEPARMLSLKGAQASQWSLYELIPTSGYIGALAMEGDIRHLLCWHWVYFDERSKNQWPFGG